MLAASFRSPGSTPLIARLRLAVPSLRMTIQPTSVRYSLASSSWCESPTVAPRSPTAGVLQMIRSRRMTRMDYASTRSYGGSSDSGLGVTTYGAEAAKYMGHVPDHVSESCIWPPLGPLSPWGVRSNWFAGVQAQAPAQSSSEAHPALRGSGRGYSPGEFLLGSMERARKSTADLPVVFPEVAFQQRALISKGMSFERWLELGKILAHIESAVQFYIGDYLNIGEKAYGEKYSQAVDEKQAQLWTHYAWVARSVAPCLRKHDLSYKHYEAVASLDERDQERWLSKAVKNKWGFTSCASESGFSASQSQSSIGTRPTVRRLFRNSSQSSTWRASRNATTQRSRRISGTSPPRARR